MRTAKIGQVRIGPSVGKEYVCISVPTGYGFLTERQARAMIRKLEEFLRERRTTMAKKTVKKKAAKKTAKK